MGNAVDCTRTRERNKPGLDLEKLAVPRHGGRRKRRPVSSSNLRW